MKAVVPEVVTYTCDSCGDQIHAQRVLLVKRSSIHNGYRMRQHDTHFCGWRCVCRFIGYQGREDTTEYDFPPVRRPDFSDFAFQELDDGTTAEKPSADKRGDK
jgi:hypothetical protein